MCARGSVPIDYCGKMSKFIAEVNIFTAATKTVLVRARAAKFCRYCNFIKTRLTDKARFH